MKNKNFEEQTKTYLIDDFRKKLNEHRKNYNKVQKQFRGLCKELDVQPLNEECVNEIAVHLTVHLSQLDMLDKKIKDIAEIIDDIESDLLN